MTSEKIGKTERELAGGEGVIPLYCAKILKRPDQADCSREYRRRDTAYSSANNKDHDCSMDYRMSHTVTVVPTERIMTHYSTGVTLHTLALTIKIMTPHWTIGVTLHTSALTIRIMTPR